MEPTLDPSDSAYMSLLTRNIPGVGTRNIPGVGNPPRAATTAHISNDEASMSSLTIKQKEATRALEEAQKVALFVSEGEEPFRTVHIIPRQSITQETLEATGITATTSQQPLPTEAEFIQLLREAQLITIDGDEMMPEIKCERTTDLTAIQNNTYPDWNKIEKALCDLFGYGVSTAGENATVALYRVTLPSCMTKVHLWVVGWVDHHLLGLHTISIET
ncbi:hypothetical protein BGZ65_005522 [Modicella reniformis]|uniref:Uncharacterized protein n=1 Tax=Modicella reniformis TaxID=1440133 RepID=A0A9P6MH12_9FUNG|nr:hypothetical protein BGZ65_005522 [Modicella reniformis]